MGGRLAAHIRGNLVAYVALFVALGGTTYAAGSKLLPKNSVGTKQVINHSLRRVDFARGQIPRGSRGATGPAGAPGVKGTTGPQGIGVASIFGLGLGGDITLGANGTLVADAYYRNLTLAPGVSVNTNGYRLFVSGTLTLNAGSSIQRNGVPATGGTGGDALPFGTLGESGAGASSGQCATTFVDFSMGGNGGGSGFGEANHPTFGSGGPHPLNSALTAISGRLVNGIWFRGGGGGGAGSGCQGAGGGGGGVVVVIARNVVVHGTAQISANGGKGATYNGTVGGGGGGGVVAVVSTSPQPAGLTLSVKGGLDGAGTTASKGDDGTSIWLN